MESNEVVVSPPGYNRTAVETIDEMRGASTKEEFNGFLKNSVRKYIGRAGGKDPVDIEFAKAVWYAAMLYLENGGTTDKLLSTVDDVARRYM